MGLENINFSAGIPLTQNAEGAGAATGDAQSNPLLFLQQLLAQLQNLTGGQQEALPTDLQAMLKNAPAGDKPEGGGAMDALKAALAALQSGKGTNPPEGGKNLPVDGAAVGTELPEGVAVLLNGAQGCGARECAAENASTDGPSAAAPGKQDQAAPAVVDGQASIPMPVVMVVPPPPPQPLSPPPAATGGGAEHADAAALALQGAVIRGAAQQAHTPQSGVLMESLEASAAKRAPGPVGPEALADMTRDTEVLVGGRGEAFANTLASVAAGGGINLPSPPDFRGSAPVAPPPVATPVGEQGWHQEFGDRIVWMTGKSMDSASIHLNPPHLGPVEVRITMNHDQQASIQFVSEHAAVREAIEAAVPRLREMMGGQQVNLADVNVSNQPSQQQSAQRDESRSQNPQQPSFSLSRQDGDSDDAALVDPQRVVRTSSGVLSLYA